MLPLRFCRSSNHRDPPEREGLPATNLVLVLQVLAGIHPAAGDGREVPRGDLAGVHPFCA
jgi:hypothetical protein